MFVSFCFLVLLASASAQSLGSVDAKCALCGLAVNELEALLVQEPTAEKELADFLTQKVCPKFSGAMQAACTLLANSAGLIVKAWDEKHSVSSVCFDLKLCSVDINADPDLQPMPTYQLNLDLAPEQRWAQMCSMDKVKTHLQGLVALFKGKTAQACPCFHASLRSQQCFCKKKSFIPTLPRHLLNSAMPRGLSCPANTPSKCRAAPTRPALARAWHLFSTWPTNCPTRALVLWRKALTAKSIMRETWTLDSECTFP